MNYNPQYSLAIRFIWVVLGLTFLSSSQAQVGQVISQDIYLTQFTNSIQRVLPKDWVVASPAQKGSLWSEKGPDTHIYFYSNKKPDLCRTPMAILILLPENYSPHTNPNRRVIRLPLLAKTSRHQVYLLGKPYRCGWTNSLDQIISTLSSLEPDILVNMLSDEKIEQIYAENNVSSRERLLATWDKQYASLSKHKNETDGGSGPKFRNHAPEPAEGSGPAPSLEFKDDAPPVDAEPPTPKP